MALSCVGRGGEADSTAENTVAKPPSSHPIKRILRRAKPPSPFDALSEEPLIEILQPLPLKPVNRSKLVSKRGLNDISTPTSLATTLATAPPTSPLRPSSSTTPTPTIGVFPMT
ncbi:hypothetical protein Acr_00g0035730 [Actinidia rufa]|uniref:Uncharacterized protein n=1 Tax=Actinidia rufa TaxID=165716 RepID=A0A7J0DIA0_9ERIC|nr:hypothetical protein Acr_00g0035730 [Actinidia rufa]